MYRESEGERAIIVMAARGRVFGVDRRTGDVQWEVVLSEELDNYSAKYAVELLITDDRVYAATWMSSMLVCIAYPSGEELGRVGVPLGGSGRPMLLADGDQIFMARDGSLAAMNRDGGLEWVQRFDEKKVGATPAALGVPGAVRQADDRYQS